MTTPKHQANIPFTHEDGRVTVVAQELLDKLVDEVRRLRTEVDDHETRITALEP